MTDTLTQPRPETPPEAHRKSGIWDRQLHSYPENRQRSLYLGVTVLATIILYYELYVQGAVATQIISHYGFTFTEFIVILAIGNAFGAFASLAAGLADRWGRANLVVVGLFITGLLILLALPHAPNRLSYGLAFTALSIVEGVVLVASPALIRDFSPQVGRGAAMGFWTLGPVLGSLVTTEITSNTLNSHPGFRFQFYLCGGIGLAVAVIAFFTLRELSPALRDQLMVSLDDRALIEARAKDLDPEQEMKGAWRQMLRVDIIGSAFAIGVYLLLYYMLVAFAVIYFATVYGYSEARANSLLNWFWIANAISLVITGIASDKVRVRKPFMLLGAAIGLVGAGLFANSATDASVSYYTLAFYLMLSAIGGGLAYVAWMAAFTETVEKHNPAATATGLAVWGWILRTIVTVGFLALIVAVPATSVLVDKGQRAQALLAKYPAQIATLSKIDPITASFLSDPLNVAAQGQAVAEIAGNGVTLVDVAILNDIQTKSAEELKTLMAVSIGASLTLLDNPTDPAALKQAITDVSTKFNISAAAATDRLVAAAQAIPPASRTVLLTKGAAIQGAVTDLKAAAEIPAADQAFLSKNGSDVKRAQVDNPKQWKRWWIICAFGQIVFIPMIFLLTGRWSPKKAREDELEHEALVQREMAVMASGGGAPPVQMSTAGRHTSGADDDDSFVPGFEHGSDDDTVRLRRSNPPPPEQ